MGRILTRPRADGSSGIKGERASGSGRLEVKFALGRISSARQKQLRDMATAHRAALLEEWTRKVKVE